MQAPETTYEVSGGADVETIVHRTEDYTREEPLKAVAIAFGAGLLMTLLPVGAIAGGLLRLALALVRPGLLVLGAIKLYEELDRRQNG